MHIDWFVLFCQIFNFLLLVYLLKRFLYGRIIKAMDDREAKIAARFAQAEELKVKATEAAEIYDRRNQLLGEKSEQMLNEASIAAEAKRKELMEKVRADVELIKVRWQDMLIREQEAFFQDLRQRASQQIYATARRALTDLADADLEQRIVDVFIRRIRELDKVKTEEIRNAISSGGNRVVVQSAFGVSDEMRRQIESALKKQITNGFTIRYMMEPEIVSGIELRVNGHKIAWSLNDYLETLVENLTETLQREAQGVS
jgi:F-type H+-transporting ATPase subunit b